MTEQSKNNENQLNKLIKEYELTSGKTFKRVNFDEWLKDKNTTDLKNLQMKYNQLKKENQHLFN